MTTPTLVFGDDRSTCADRAWLWINRQRWPGWTVDVVTAQPRPDDVTSNDLPVRLSPWIPADARVPFAESGIAHVRHLRSSADPGIALRTCTHASLLVVGPRGTRGVRSLLVGGSTAEDLLRRPPAPLLVATRPRPAARVLVCTDGSDEAQHAAVVFARLPLAETAARIGVLGVAATDGPERDLVRRGVTAAARHLAHPRLEVIDALLERTVAETIGRFAADWRADLVVMGTHGPTALERLVRGSVSGDATHLLASPVLVVPRVADSGGSAVPIEDSGVHGVPTPG